MIRIRIADHPAWRQSPSRASVSADGGGGGPDGAVSRPADFGWMTLAVAQGEAQRRAEAEAQAKADEAAQQRDDQLNDAGSKSLDAAYVSRIGTILNDYRGKTGLAAVAARADVEQQARDLYDKILSQASTPVMRTMTQAVLDVRLAGDIADFDAHAAEQLSYADDQASLARQGLSALQAATARDPAVAARDLATGLNEIGIYAQRKGWRRQAAEAERTRYASGVHADRILARADAGDLDGAEAYRGAQDAYLTDADRQRIDRSLAGPLARQQGRTDADRLLGIGTRNGGGFSYTDPLHGAGRGLAPEVPAMDSAPDGVAIAAPPGIDVHPIAPGTVTRVERDAAGVRIEIDHGGGETSTYSRLGAAHVAPGERVMPDTPLGDSGETPLRWTMTRGGVPVDAATLTGLARRGYAEADLPALLARVDREAAAEAWPAERIERVKDEVIGRLSRETQQRTMRQDQARDAALGAIEGSPQPFTSIDQLPASVVADLAPDVVDRLEAMARANLRGLEAEPNGATAAGLNLLAFEDRRRFLDTDLRLHRDQLTPDEYDSLSKLQTDPAALATHQAIWATILRRMPGSISEQSSRQQIFSAMAADLTGGDKARPTSAQIDEAFDGAVLSGDLLTDAVYRSTGESSLLYKTSSSNVGRDDRLSKRWRRLTPDQRLQDTELAGAAQAVGAAAALLRAGDRKLLSKLGPTRFPGGKFVAEQIVNTLARKVIPEQLDSGKTYRKFPPGDLQSGGDHMTYLYDEIVTASNYALNARQRFAFDYLTSPAGGAWTKEQAAGIVNNLTEESNLDPEKLQSNKVGYGIAQWTVTGRGKTFAEHTGRPLQGSSFLQQLAFLVYELSMGAYKAAGKKLRAARTASEASSIFTKKFEIPQDPELKAEQRAPGAERILVEFTKKKRQENEK